MDDEGLLRVHSADLHDHVAQEVGECLESGLYTDLMIRCKDGHTLHAHKLVLSAVSLYLKMLLESNDWEELQTLELPDVPNEIVSLLLEVIYNGVVEATIDDLRELIILSHSLYINIPLSDDLMQVLDVVLPPRAPLVMRSPPKLKQRPVFNTTNNNQPAKPKLPIPPPLKAQAVPKNPDKTRMVFPIDNAVVLSNAVMGKNLDHVCPICNSKFSSIGSFKQHMKYHDNDNLKDQRTQILAEMVATCYNPTTALYTCSICKSNYNHSGNFKQHLLKHEREAGSISAMLVAKAKETGATNLEDVIINTTAIQVPKVTPTEREPGKNFYTCEHCGRAFNHAGNYKQHVASHIRSAITGRPSPKLLKHARSQQLSGFSAKRLKLGDDASSGIELFCSECNLQFPTDEELENHIIAMHSSEISKRVDQDNGSPNHNQEHENHIDLTDDEKAMVEVSSAIISKPSKNGGADSSEKMVIPTYKCKVCNKKFLSMTKLSMHLKIHSSPDDHYRFPCNICGKKFTRLQHVNRHKLIHTNENLFKCPNCDQSFSDEETLKYHLDSECHAGQAETYEDQAEELEADFNGQDEHDEEDLIEIPPPSVILAD